MFDLIVAVFKLKGDSYLVFRHRRDLETLYSETLVAQNDIVERSVHLLLEELAKRSEAKDFVRKIAKIQRDSETQRDSGWYCKKCLQILHRMCIGNPDETFVVTMPPEC
ncbi:uncharacterized protein LOC117293227 [Asterias rubens]|uniref:uncharacterized protein LOC117293227 n=1 Tax=Asterias rubens TaxID=7604 RepID=UPI001455CE8E|nr:uncharacterized protein LOC117293227 [Asterias rubens]